MMNEGMHEEVEQIIANYVAAHDDVERIWAKQMVFTWHWWVDVGLAVLPWILFVLVRNKRNTHRLLYAGMFTAFAATFLDIIGVTQAAWHYNTLLLPLFPEFLPWDFTVMPVSAMLFYQFFPKISPWLKGAVFGGFAAYVVEPVFTWLKFYEPTGWQHYYSLLIYYAIFMIGYFLYTRTFSLREEM